MSEAIVLHFEYTNHKGRTERRRARPIRVFQDEVPWYEGVHVYLLCHDCDKGEDRTFMLSRMKDVTEGAPAGAPATGV